MSSNLFDTLKRAVASNRAIVIEGYRSENGEVSNLTVRAVGSDGYRRLVKESLEQLDKLQPSTPSEDWFTAVGELKQSWERTLSGGSAKRAFTEKLEVSSDGVAVGDKGLALLNLEKLGCDKLSEAAKTVNSSSKTKAKNDIVSQLPLGRYLGRVNLYPGKFKNIRVVEG